MFVNKLNKKEENKNKIKVKQKKDILEKKEKMSYNTGEFKGLNAPATDNEDDDCPPEFTTLAHEQEKCLLSFKRGLFFERKKQFNLFFFF